MERCGADHWRAGPRLPRNPGLPPESEAIGDPAKGEPVPRCAVCGAPELPGNKLIPGLFVYIRFSMPLNLCEKCLRHYAPPIDVDPLTLEEVA